MNKTNYKWVLTVTTLAFILSIIMSFIMTVILKEVNLVISIIFIFIFILLGIIFDIIGVSVTCADEVVFHSMSSRKIKGGSSSVMLIKNANKVSSICCDVIGDICGIITGSAGITVLTIIIKLTNFNEIITSLVITAIISSLTIGGKAIGKNIAIKKANEVITIVGKLLSIFTRK